MIPGFFIWGTLALAGLVILWQPRWALFGLLLFDLAWLLRMYYLLGHILLTWRNYRRALRVDWSRELAKEYPSLWREYWQLIILPTYGEPYSIVQRTLQSLAHSRYPRDRLLVVLAGEQRDADRFAAVADRAQAEFGSQFFRFLVTLHPDGLPGEIAGKGSNLRHAARHAQRVIDALQLSYDQVIVSSFDVDTCPHPQYFSLLTLTYLKQPDPLRASFQPIAVYTNNVWSSHPIVRVVAGTTTFWLMTDLARPERLFTFSSHSMSFATLVAVNFWDPAIVTEDSRIFLQCLAHYRGDYRVVPVPLPLTMHTVDVGRLWRSLWNQYRQIRRWAWSVEHFPWMVEHFWGRSKVVGIPTASKLRYFFNLSEGLYSWATAPLLIFLFSRLAWWRLSFAVSGAEHALISQALFKMTVLGAGGLLVFSALYLTLLGPNGPRSARQLPVIIAQWLLMPLTLVFFGALPAIESQTRLMLGGRFRLGFDVTEKV